MAYRIHVLLWFGVVWPTICTDVNLESREDFGEDRWMFYQSKLDNKDKPACMKIQPLAKDVVRRIYAILPYLDKDNTNSAFLHKLRTTISTMSDSADMLDREASFYAAIFIPLIFLQQYRDTWCLLERFHRSLRLYELSSLSDKRSALKVLQNIRGLNQKIRNFIFELPGPSKLVHRTQAPSTVDIDDDVTLHDKKDIKYLKELIRNLG